MNARANLSPPLTLRAWLFVSAPECAFQEEVMHQRQSSGIRSPKIWQPGRIEIVIDCCTTAPSRIT